MTRGGVISTVTVSYLTFTPKYYFLKGPSEVYGGLGIGTYATDLKLETPLVFEERPTGVGVNLLIGWEIRINPLAGLLIEDKIIGGSVSTSVGTFHFGENTS